MPRGCNYYRVDGRLSPPASSSPMTLTGDLWARAIQFTTHASSRPLPSPGYNLCSVPDLLGKLENASIFAILDWRAERSISHRIDPLVESCLFSPGKTYVLFGLTRDIGASLTRLLAEHGARHIVLASRNPPERNPPWKREFSGRGVTIRFESAAVTNLDSIRSLRATVEEDMPPIGGVVNGCMILDDRVFCEMDLRTLNRVMSLKATGSRNLDELFDSPELEFFIMTSSFAAIGGHLWAS